MVQSRTSDPPVLLDCCSILVRRWPPADRGSWDLGPLHQIAANNTAAPRLCPVPNGVFAMDARTTVRAELLFQELGWRRQWLAGPLQQTCPAKSLDCKTMLPDDGHPSGCR